MDLKEVLWEFLFNSIDQGFCIVEMIFDEQKKPIDYRFLKVNSPFENQTGLVNAVGKRMREFAPNHEEHWFEIYGKVALTGESVRFENRAEQLHRWFDVNAFRFGDPTNFQVAILFNDITLRKESEEKIQLLNKELEQKIPELEFAYNELDAFSHSVSHDLQAPLRSINGFVNILVKELSKEPSYRIKESLKVIGSSSRKMENLIQDMLAFSHVSKNEVVRSLVHTEQIVNNIINDLYRQHAIDKSIFKIENLPPMTGDSAMLNQVWVNLISNAYKYSSKKESPRVEIGSQQTNGETIYYVKDNGAGFDMEFYDKLFGVFQRLHDNNEFEGTGVGLAIAQRIVNRHQGKIWAEAKVDEGATFYFTLPN
ncbi:MAG: ATP-binding protein [Bacteroidota bacterium]